MTHTLQKKNIMTHLYMKDTASFSHDGIFNQIKNVEEEEMKYRPLERIISIEEQNDEIIIKTTYEHLARKIGEAIAHKGDLKLNYPEGKKYVRVYWQREE